MEPTKEDLNWINENVPGENKTATEIKVESMNKSEYKYVAFKLIGDWNVTVRADSREELLAEMNWAKANIGIVYVPQTNSVPAYPAPVINYPTQNYPIPVPQGHTCALHGVEMKPRNFKGEDWFDHRKQENGVWLQCRGDGFKASGGKSY